MGNKYFLVRGIPCPLPSLILPTQPLMPEGMFSLKTQ